MKNSSPKLLVTGGNGQLAQALAKHSNIQALPKDVLNITDACSIEQAIKHYTPDMIINAAAYTAVDKAETEKELALQINHLGAKNLAIACQEQHIPLLHVSTDYVFDGKANRPYSENDSIHPINFYGESKWLGEQAVREHCEQHYIIRVSGIYSDHGQNFFKTMIRLAKERKELNIVSDQITCPTHADDIANAIITLSNHRDHHGTYHFCSTPPLSWFEFASEIIEHARKQHTLAVQAINAISSADYITPAKRPAYSVLSCEKIKANFGIEQPIRTYA